MNRLTLATRLGGKTAMIRLTNFTSYEDAKTPYSKEALWELFDGDRDSFNIANECVARQVDRDNLALRIAHSDGHDAAVTFKQLCRRFAQIAHYLASTGIETAPALR
jgi:acetyl-CoA synthetase